MSDDEFWVNVTAIGDEWEVEMDANSRNRFRHRPLAFIRHRDDLGIYARTEQWTDGPPPTGMHAAPERKHQST